MIKEKRPYDDSYCFPNEVALMTEKEAQWILKERNSETPCTWRMLAGLWVEKFHPDLDDIAGNQLLGVDLCKRALDVLSLPGNYTDKPLGISKP